MAGGLPTVGGGVMSHPEARAQAGARRPAIPASHPTLIMGMAVEILIGSIPVG